MNIHLYKVDESRDPEEIEMALSEKGLLHPFRIEQEEGIFVGGYGEIAPSIEGASLVLSKDAEIDWNREWETFSPFFHDGMLQIDLTPFGGKGNLLLKPGAGFGDLSHPTTLLILEIMAPYVKNEVVVDIGTGSGVLALAALLMGANSAKGVDIDKEALVHARKNAKLNHLSVSFSKKLDKPSFPSVFLMNLILPEQKRVNPMRLNQYAKTWITSGILASQENEYLLLTSSWGWTPLAQKEKEGWLAFVFAKSPSK